MHCRLPSRELPVAGVDGDGARGDGRVLVQREEQPAADAGHGGYAASSCASGESKPSDVTVSSELTYEDVSPQFQGNLNLLLIFIQVQNILFFYSISLGPRFFLKLETHSLLFLLSAPSLLTLLCEPTNQKAWGDPYTITTKSSCRGFWRATQRGRRAPPSSTVSLTRTARSKESEIQSSLR
jgi:hypothetical protein